MATIRKSYGKVLVNAAESAVQLIDVIGNTATYVNRFSTMALYKQEQNQKLEKSSYTKDLALESVQRDADRQAEYDKLVAKYGTDFVKESLKEANELFA